MPSMERPRRRGPFRWGMRPEHIDLVEADAGQIEGTVDVLEYLGADTFLILSCGEAGQITVRVNGSVHFEPGDTVGLTVPEEMLHWFSSDGLAIH
jgi:multiple sugar transport system ATP-binding protein